MNVTEEALIQLKQLCSEQDSPGIGVRIFTSSGCCGPKLHMSIVDQVEEGDSVLNINDLNFFVEHDAEELTRDLVVDFTDEKFHFRMSKQPRKCC